MEMSDIFIAPIQLARMLEVAPDSVKVFDCRFALAQGATPAKGIEFYQAAHIAGARYLDLEQDLSATPDAISSRHPWPTISQVRQLAESLQLTPDTSIVCYDDGRYAFAGRAWLLLNQAGFTRSRILYGGFPAWQSRSSAPFAETSIELPFAAAPAPVTLVTANDLSQPLLDAREATRFRGQSEPIDPVAGTIPGAENAPWLDNFDDNGEWQPLSWHQARWQSAQQREPITHFCGSGVTAIVNIISALLGSGKPQQLYPGGWSEYLHRINSAKRR